MYVVATDWVTVAVIEAAEGFLGVVVREMGPAEAALAETVVGM